MLVAEDEDAGGLGFGGEVINDAIHLSFDICVGGDENGCGFDRVLSAEPVEFARAEDGGIEGEEAALGLSPETGAVADVDGGVEDPGVANGVDRGAGFLSEPELEVVFDPPWEEVEHRGEGGVVAHRAEGRFSGGGHGFEDDLDVFFGHAKGELGGEQRTGREGLGDGDRFAGNHSAHRRGEGLASNFFADFVVQRDPARVEVNEDGFAGAEDALLLDFTDVDGASELGDGEHKVLADLGPEGAKAVSVEVGDGDIAIAADQGGRTIARTQVDASGFVEIAKGIVGGEDGLGGRQETEHGLLEAHSSGEESDHHVVEVCGIRASGADDRSHKLGDRAEGGEALDEVADKVLTDGLHPGDVAVDGRDFAVMGDGPERLGASPGGSGIGAVPAVEENVSALEVGALEVGVEIGDLGEVAEALVNDGAVGERADREFVSREGGDGFVEGESEEVAASEPAFLAHVVRALEEGLADPGKGAESGRAFG